MHLRGAMGNHRNRGLYGLSWQRERRVQGRKHRECPTRIYLRRPVIDDIFVPFAATFEVPRAGLDPEGGLSLVERKRNLRRTSTGLWNPRSWR